MGEENERTLSDEQRAHWRRYVAFHSVGGAGYDLFPNDAEIVTAVDARLGWLEGRVAAGDDARTPVQHTAAYHEQREGDALRDRLEMSEAVKAFAAGTVDELRRSLAAADAERERLRAIIRRIGAVVEHTGSCYSCEAFGPPRCSRCTELLALVAQAEGER